MIFLKDEILGHESDLEWSTFLREIANLSRDRTEWIFRALRPCAKLKPPISPPVCLPILSSFDEACQRQPPTGLKQTQRRLYEAWMLREFKREAHNFLSDRPRPDDSLEWLALARHYGMPTRLVDFSYSFLVSAYFAQSERKYDEYGLVLAINLTWMKADVEQRLWEWRNGHGVAHRRAAFQEPQLFRRFAFRSRPTYVVPVNPMRRNRRLAAQRALFLCPGDIRQTFDVNIEQTVGQAKDVKKLILLPPSARSETIVELQRMNINSSSLYRDLGGWAASRADLVHFFPIRDRRLMAELALELWDPRS